MPHNEGDFSQKWIAMVTAHSYDIQHSSVSSLQVTYGKENAIKMHLTFSAKVTATT